MIKAVFRYFFPAPAPQPVQEPPISLKDIPRYPPFDRGLPLISAHDIARSQQDIIDRIEKTAGMTPDEFNTRVRPVIENLAKYVHLLPATSNGHHRGAGGLFRLALEIGLYSLQRANATIFVNKGTVSVEARYNLQPRWVYATFLAALCSDIYRPITTMVVVDDEGDKWPQLLMPLHTWASSREKQRYFIVWNVQDDIDTINFHQASSAYLINTIIPANCLQWLNEDNSEIVSTMTACITGAVKHGVPNQIHAITSVMRSKVIERDIKSSSDRYGVHLVGSHLEPHLIDAMRRLVRSGTWLVNDKGARIWHSEEGLFLVWKPASREIIKLLMDDNQPGIPQDADTLADILVSSGIADRNDDDGSYWEIVEPKNMSVLTAIKLRRPEICFPEGVEHALLESPLLLANISKLEEKAKAKASSTKKKADKAPAPVTQATLGLVVEEEVKAEVLPIQKTNDAQDDVQEEVVSSKNTNEIPSTPLSSEAVVDTPAPVIETLAPPKPVKKVKPSKKEAVPLGSMAKGLLGSLTEADSQLLQLIIDDYQQNQSEHPVFCTDGGIAISTQELASNGNSSYFSLIKALHDKGWLWVDPAYPLRKAHDLEHEGKTISCMVIRDEIARGMGFDWKAPRKEST